MIKSLEKWMGIEAVSIFYILIGLSLVCITFFMI